MPKTKGSQRCLSPHPRTLPASLTALLLGAAKIPRIPDESNEVQGQPGRRVRFGFCYSSGFTEYFLLHITAPSASLFCSFTIQVWFVVGETEHLVLLFNSVSPVLKCYSKMKRSFFRTTVTLNRLTIHPYLISEHWIHSGLHESVSTDDKRVRAQ